MADPSAATVQSFVTVLLDGANGSLQRAVDGLTDEQVYHQPTQDTNSIAWLAWHMNRWQDYQGHVISGEEQVWARDGWCERFALPVESTGLGDTPAQVAAFRPPLDLLWEYTEAAHTTFIQRVNALSQEQLEEMVRYLPHLEPRPRWRITKDFDTFCRVQLRYTGKKLSQAFAIASKIAEVDSVLLPLKREQEYGRSIRRSVSGH